MGNRATATMKPALSKANPTPSIPNFFINGTLKPSTSTARASCVIATRPTRPAIRSSANVMMTMLYGMVATPRTASSTDALAAYAEP